MINNSLLELILNDICTTLITWNKMFLYFQYPSDHAFVCVCVCVGRGGGGSLKDMVSGSLWVLLFLKRTAHLKLQTTVFCPMWSVWVTGHWVTEHKPARVGIKEPRAPPDPQSSLWSLGQVNTSLALSS